MRTHSLALSCALLAPLSLLPLQVYATVASGSAAQIVSLQGDGEQRATDAQPWSAAKTTQLLPGGAYVRTRAGAKMALLFADDTQVRLNQNSVLQVKSLANATQPTTLALSLGRAWAQTKRSDGSRLNLETPAATAGIRGTDWELDVDGNGKTLLTVLSGTVEFANAQGAVTVGSNEAALAEVGRAPVKIQLSQPRDRIQWVNALTADPTRHLHADQVPTTPDGPWPAILASARAIQSGDSAGARRLLNALVDAPQGAPAAAYLMLSDLQLVDGAFDAAANTLEAGLSRHPGDADLLAQLAKTYLLADRLDDSAQVLARTRNADTASVLLAQGELARRQGQAAATEEAFARATRVAPLDDRGWFGLGSAQNEREAITPARANLQKALELKPQGAGYRGELGTLETFANRFDQADAAFAKALEDNPADYVSWTGLGLLRLKQGQPQAALDAFLRAGVMEPRYARAKTYTGVAYYQLGRHADAIDTLRQATVLDDKDPVPYVFLSQIYTDLFRAGDAVQASRDAVQRLPYLKSLNQVASDQKGSANFGSALAFFGLEDWALELAQDSYYPYWGGSHLFLADRYAGEFNKNSELFQGFLSDPLAFGASNRFSSLLQRSGHYGAVGLNVEKSQWHLQTPSLTLNGTFNDTVPIAYFLQSQPARGTDSPIDVNVPNSIPVFSDATGKADVQATVTTFGVGVQPSEKLGLFAYFNEFRASLRGHNDPIGLGESTSFDHVVRHRAVGLSYRWSPTEQTWFKLGSSNEITDLRLYPTLVATNNAIGVLGLNIQPAKSFDDIQIRHTLDLSPATRVSVGLERVTEWQGNGMQGIGVVSASSGGQTMSDLLAMGGTNVIDRRFTALTVAGQHRPTKDLLLDGALTANRLKDNSEGDSEFYLKFSNLWIPDSVRTNTTADQTAARVGLAYKPHDQFTLRAAYQDWVRPLSVSTLNSVETAGIPIEDRLVEAGGRLKRGVVQMGWTPREDTFLSVKLDRMDVHNLTSPGVDLRTPGLPFLEQLRNAQTVNLSSLDALEDTPSFEDGTVSALTLSANRMFSKQLSGYAKYTLQETSSSYEDSDAPSGRVTDKRIPYMPRETAILGATLAAGSRTYLGARAVYRSERFEDKGNMTPWPAGWSLDLVGFWETADKHWVIGLGALNLGGVKSNRQTDRYVLDARYRF